MMLNFLDSIVW